MAVLAGDQAPKGGKDYYRVRIDGKEWEFQKGEVNEFNSTRKR